MGLRFQKRIKVLPGVTVNLSKSGVSTSVGVTGARVTMGHGQTRTTVGVPGTGVSHTTITPDKQSEPVAVQGVQGEASSPLPELQKPWWAVGMSLAGKMLVVIGVAMLAIGGFFAALFLMGSSTKPKRGRGSKYLD